MKATGMGILLEPGSFGISFHGGSIRAVPCADQREFYFREYIRNDGYCYSRCCLSDAFPDTMTQVEMNMILTMTTLRLWRGSGHYRKRTRSCQCLDHRFNLRPPNCHCKGKVRRCQSRCVCRQKRKVQGKESMTVSYTHLTLPTKAEV